MRRHFIVLQSCLAWRKRDSKEGGGSVVMVCVSVCVCVGGEVDGGVVGGG